MMLSSITLHFRFLYIALEGVVPPIALTLDALLIKKDASAVPDTLKVEAGEDRTIWLEATAVASGITVFEGAFVHAIIRKDHPAHAIWLAEFVDSANVDVLLRLQRLNLKLSREEPLVYVFLNLVDAVTGDLLAQLEHVLRIVNFLLEGVEEAG